MKRICLVTSAHISYNPRLVKEADALTSAGFSVRVVGLNLEDAKWELDCRLVKGRSWGFTAIDVRKSRKVGRSRWLKAGIRQAIFRKWRRLWRTKGGLEHAYSRYWPELARLAGAHPTDLFIAHNLPALPAAAAAAARWRAKLGFDAEDFHRGEFLNTRENELILRLTTMVEEKYLPRCHHVTAASPGIAQAYVNASGIPTPRTILNVFPKSERSGRTPPSELARERRGEGVSLYWYSQTLGPDRGLEDALRAVALLGDRVRLHIRGAWAAGYESDFRKQVAKLGIGERVHLLPVVPPEELVERAAQHDVGLALETGHWPNNALAISNKLLVYLLGGLAIAATDVPGQKGIMEQTVGAGFLYRPGDAAGLARNLEPWLEQHETLSRAKANSRRFGEERFCWEVEQHKFISAVNELFDNQTS